MFAARANVLLVIAIDVEKMLEVFFIAVKRWALLTNAKKDVVWTRTAIPSIGLQFTREDGAVQIKIHSSSKNRSEILFFALKLSFVMKRFQVIKFYIYKYYSLKKVYSIT